LAAALQVLFASALPKAASTTIKWHDALRQKPEWYGSDEAERIAWLKQLASAKAATK